MKVAIYGAGPAGLIAAEKLLQQGFEVHIFDRMVSPARKFLMAGRGGLNLTHSENIEEFLSRYHDCPPWFLDIIRDFSPQDLQTWAHDLGIETFIGSSGRVFPKAMKASPLLRAWLKRLDKAHFHFKHEFTGVQDGYDATILAMGGGSWAKLGSNGAWVSILRRENIMVHDLTPANCGFKVNWSQHMAKTFGLPLKNTRFNGIMGEAMITRDGIEGNAIYALSNALSKEKTPRITMDFKPDMAEIPPNQSKQSLATYYRKLGLSPAQIALMFETKATSPKNVTLNLTEAYAIDRAISSRGGVDFNELNADLELKSMKNVYIAGEMLAFDAPTGGYLLQACFSSGVRAAQSIINKHSRR
jgi:uncharacterized flavoprotein (TIGR03862 family)